MNTRLLTTQQKQTLCTLAPLFAASRMVTFAQMRDALQVTDRQASGFCGWLRHHSLTNKVAGGGTQSGLGYVLTEKGRRIFESMLGEAAA